MTSFSTSETTKEDTLKCPLLVFRKLVALAVYRTPPDSGFSIGYINYQLLQFAAAGAALRTIVAAITLNRQTRFLVQVNCFIFDYELVFFE